MSQTPSFAEIETLTAHTIAGLAMDAVQAANSGHPGMPMGMADIATVLWTRFVRYDPSQPDWPDRDRVVLSNGHGSMLLYSMLHLTGTSLSLDDLKNFRQWGSPAAGHPEFGEAAGIETTTGPLGQGIANGVGMALAERWLAARFGPELVDHHTWVLTGDGCLMEGVAAEAASLAGHLGLGRLIVLYDDNQITIDGSTALSFTEDVAERFRAYGWHTERVDGHDHEAIGVAIAAAKAETDRPSLICCRTIIAKGSPGKAGSNDAHGAPLGAEEIRATKLALGMDPERSFVVPPEVVGFVRGKDAERQAEREAWEGRLAASPHRARWERFHGAPDVASIQWPAFPAGKAMATRKSGGMALTAAAATLEQLLGGSADLAGSNNTKLAGGDVSRGNFEGRNLHFGIREHGMAAICNGLSLHGGIIPFCATFMVFHDYMRPSVRLAALMHRQVIYVYTHDSIFVGEDGPTHQPIEQLMAMRTIPNLHVIRPADAAEAKEAWKVALERADGPTALCLSRQNLPTYDRSRCGAADGLARGAYVLSDAADPQVVLIGTGSEVALAMSAQEQLQADGIRARVVSMPCWERFAAQDAAWRSAVLPRGVPRVSVEAGITGGWQRWTGDDGAQVGIDRFGASAPGEVVAQKLGLTVEAVVAAARQVLG